MRAATLRLLATAALAARADAALPAALAQASSVLKSGRVLAQLRTFFASGGPGSRFRIGLELGCVEGGQRLGTAASRQWRKPADHDLLDSKWGLESSLPLMVASSPWFARPGERANASLVVFRPRAHARSDLSRCRAAVDPRNDRTDLWFVAMTDRGRCCDGGQLRDPGLLRHHFLVVAGERATGEWLFREHSERHAWRAPPTRDTAPRVRCFDNAMDVALPPPAFLRRRGDEQAAAAATARARNASRRWLAMHAEGGVSPPEYDLRRALSTLYAPDWWENKGKVPPFGDELYVRKKMARPEHAEALFASKFCLVVEGFAPWTPRLAEAIAAGCVPAFLSPAYRPPFADVLDWPAFSATLRRDDVGTLRDALAKLDHAALHANLLKVRDLFAFHVDAGGAGGALPLAVFEMWRRARARARGGDRYAGRDGRPGVVAALVAADGAPARGRARAARADVAYACADDGESCAYSLHGTTWNCSTRTPMACGCVVVR